MLSTQWRTCTLLFCWMTIGLIGGPWLCNANGDFCCYSGSVNILNGEVNVANTKSIVSQQCSPPPTSQPSSSSTPEVSSTANNSKPAVSSETPTTPSPATGASAPQTAPPSPSKPTPGASSGTTNGSTSATPTIAHTTAARKRRAAGSSVMGCVVIKSYQNGFTDNMTATFSCPTPDSPCTNVSFNGSTGTKNQTQCCVGALCNTLDSFIMRENFNYSKVGSCFVGNSTDVVQTQCGDSTNMCLTITDGDNATDYYCGDDTLQSYCQQDGALREGSFRQEVENITVRCCGSINCNTPFPPSIPTPSSMATSMPTAAPASTSNPPSTATPSNTTAISPSSNAANESTATPASTSNPPSTATPSNTTTPSPSSNATNESTATPAFTGATQTSSAAVATAGHSNKTLIMGICVAFAVGLLGGIIITVICCRRKGSTAARPGELLAFDSFQYKRMGADEVNEEVFMS